MTKFFLMDSLDDSVSEFHVQVQDQVFHFQDLLDF